MQLDFSKISYEAQEIEYQEGIKIKIRPYPMSEEEVLIEDKDKMVIALKHQCRKWIYCCISWEGITDANGKNLVCSNEIKQKMFDFKLQLGLSNLIDFVVSKADELRDKKEESLKN